MAYQHEFEENELENGENNEDVVAEEVPKKTSRTVNESHLPIGLDSEMKLGTIPSKKGRQRFRKRLDKEKEEDENNKQMLKILYEQKQVEKRQEEEAEKLRKKKEEEEKNTTYKYIKEPSKPVYKVKQKVV